MTNQNQKSQRNQPNKNARIKRPPPKPGGVPNLTQARQTEQYFAGSASLGDMLTKIYVALAADKPVHNSQKFQLEAIKNACWANLIDESIEPESAAYGIAASLLAAYMLGREGVETSDKIIDPPLIITNKV